MSLTPDHQLQNLVNMVSGKTLNRLSLSLTMLAAALLIGGLITWHPMFFMVAVFVAVTALSAWQTSPHIRNALKGFTDGKRVQGEIFIDITSWSDSDSHQAIVMSGCKLPWKFDFIPQGWKPVEGITTAELVFIKSVGWPVLIITEAGIIYPRYTPKISDTSISK